MKTAEKISRKIIICQINYYGDISYVKKNLLLECSLGFNDNSLIFNRKKMRTPARIMQN